MAHPPEMEFWSLYQDAQNRAFAGEMHHAKTLIETLQAQVNADDTRFRRGRLELLRQLATYVGSTKDGWVDETHTTEALRAALAQDPSEPDVWLALAKANWENGNAVRARQLLRKLMASQFEERHKAKGLLQNWMKCDVGT